MQELSLNVLDIAQNSIRAGASLIAITVTERRADAFLEISIADNGCGFDPASAGKVRKFARYYMPTTLKLLRTYADVKDQQGEAAGNIRQEIGGILATLNTAFDNLRNDLLTDTALDISSEISAMQTMLAQDGLAEYQS